VISSLSSARPRRARAVPRCPCAGRVRAGRPPVRAVGAGRSGRSVRVRVCSWLIIFLLPADSLHPGCPPFCGPGHDILQARTRYFAGQDTIYRVPTTGRSPLCRAGHDSSCPYNQRISVRTQYIVSFPALQNTPPFAGQDTIFCAPGHDISCPYDRPIPALQSRTRYIVSVRPAHLCTDTIHCVLPRTPKHPLVCRPGHDILRARTRYIVSLRPADPRFAEQDTIYRVPTTGASLYGHNTLCPSPHSKHSLFCRPGHDSLQARTRYIVSLRPAHLCTDTIHCVLPRTPNTPLLQSRTRYIVSLRPADPGFAEQDTIVRVPTTGASLYGHNTLCPSPHSKHPLFCRAGHDISCPYGRRISVRTQYIVSFPALQTPLFCRPGHDISCPYDRRISVRTQYIVSFPALQTPPRLQARTRYFAEQDTIYRVPTTGRSPLCRAGHDISCPYSRRISVRTQYIVSFPALQNTSSFAGQDTIYRVPTTGRSRLCRAGHDSSCPYDRRISVRTQYIVSFPALQTPLFCRAGHDSSCPYGRRISVRTQYIVSFPALQTPLFCRPGHDSSCPYDRRISVRTQYIVSFPALQTPPRLQARTRYFARQDTIYRVPTTGRSPLCRAGHDISCPYSRRISVRTQYIVSFPALQNTSSFAGQDTIYRVPTTGASLYGHNTLCPSPHSKHTLVCRPGHDISCPYDRRISVRTQYIVSFPALQTPPLLRARGHDISCPYDRPIPALSITSD
jgi:hypothetical protein